MSKNDFELLTDCRIPEIDNRARLYRHIKTGAQLLSMENDDENKFFGIAFATPPPDATGIAHIMEHSVLCGSRKYPVKSPFAELIKGSLATFLGAYTTADKTCYPAASQNLQDFYNLIDVYLDMVLYPQITPETLMQEGWHYELDSPDGIMTMNGVVFNEERGAYTSPDRLHRQRIQQSLFPDTAYGVDAGGDPRCIPQLTYAQFKRFHETYYHPSNSFIFFYGNDDPLKRLEVVQGYLKDFGRRDIDSRVGLQSSFTEPRRLSYGYDAGEEVAGVREKGMVSVNWLLAERCDIEAALAQTILTHILMGTPASPLRKALMDSAIGGDVIGNPEDELGIHDKRQLTFSAGLKGVAVTGDEDGSVALQRRHPQLSVDLQVGHGVPRRPGAEHHLHHLDVPLGELQVVGELRLVDPLHQHPGHQPGGGDEVHRQRPVGRFTGRVVEAGDGARHPEHPLRQLHRHEVGVVAGGERQEDVGLLNAGGPQGVDVVGDPHVERAVEGPPQELERLFGLVEEGHVVTQGAQRLGHLAAYPARTGDHDSHVPSDCRDGATCPGEGSPDAVTLAPWPTTACTAPGCTPTASCRRASCAQCCASPQWRRPAAWRCWPPP